VSPRAQTLQHIYRVIRANSPNTFSVYQLRQIIAGIDARQHKQAGLHIGKELAGDVVSFMARV